MRAFRAALAVLLLLPLAGCLQSSPGPSSPPYGPAADLGFYKALAAKVPPMQVSVPASVDWWQSFVTTYAGRVAYTPVNQLAADALAGDLRSLGLDTEVQTYPVGALGVNAPAGTPGVVHVVVGKKVGTGDPTHAIVVGGHYDHFAIPNDNQGILQDTAMGAVAGREPLNGLMQAAYDNGSGTALVRALCEALSKVPMNRTLVCAFFDGEEFGTVGSKAFVSQGGAKGLTIDAYVGFDMVGINWPGVDTSQPKWAQWKLYEFTGDEFADALHPLANATLHDVLGWPDSGAEGIPNQGGRSSDEATFSAAHIPAFRFAGGRSAGLYPRYHEPTDNVQFVYDYMGGRDKFEAGFGAILQAAYTLTAMFDQTSLAAMQARTAAP
jgi:hypothetical protein